ncbi:class I SAM-dependent methyltransferase [Prosthecochloris sp. CIB 2401]|uniref:class I SAM-dependent methyltransferase n=1 Tax=Prosthecochloris sp. CIB 2401 TaxID=1868325 RepID=UPI00080AC239|nr:class I SAM-dependent methyltransferase [Prosthecochloris sp. CIB 2401]ANT65204.1 bifunctional 3-demethylubiquinone-9 3-methyltransferase/ 2-octaprenyl-6-hydroxy phenol methylase [Prosthecochloris sp. CIB 2401]
MEDPRCPISATSAVTPFLDVADRFNLETGRTWSIVQNCSSGLCYLSPRPDEREIRNHYPSTGYAPFESLEQVPSVRKMLYRWIRHLAIQSKARLILHKHQHSLAPDAAILEIGCSTGELLTSLRHTTAAECIGMEPDTNAATYARERYQLTIHEHLSDIQGRFDLIIFWHTLEHIHRINETLELTASLLKENGSIIIALPNAQAADAKHFEASWVAWDAPRHLWHFTPKTLTALLDKHGLAVTSLSAYAPDAIYNSWESQNIEHGGKPGLAGQTYGIVKGLYFAFRGAQRPEEASSFICNVSHK